MSGCTEESGGTSIANTARNLYDQERSGTPVQKDEWKERTDREKRKLSHAATWEQLGNKLEDLENSQAWAKDDSLLVVKDIIRQCKELSKNEYSIAEMIHNEPECELEPDSVQQTKSRELIQNIYNLRKKLNDM